MLEKATAKPGAFPTQVANAMQPSANDDFGHAFEHSMCFPTMMERPKVKIRGNIIISTAQTSTN